MHSEYLFFSIMSINKNQLVRLFYIMEILKQTKKPVPLEDLLTKIQNRFDLDGSPLQISERTFYRDLDKLKQAPFHLDIQHTKNDGYLLLPSSDGKWDVSLLLEPFHLLNSLDLENGLQDIIIPQAYTDKGTCWLKPLIQAVRARKVIQVKYRKHNSSDYKERILEPYYLKEFNGLWYLIAFDCEVNDYRTFGLDRIEDITIKSKTFQRDTNYDVKQQFVHSYGIYSDDKYTIEEIVFKVDLIDTNYLMTHPLHTSQHILEQSSSQVTFGIRVRYTKDLLMALLSRSWSMEIISPAYIKQEYADILKAAFERNK